MSRTEQDRLRDIQEATQAIRSHLATLADREGQDSDLLNYAGLLRSGPCLGNSA